MITYQIKDLDTKFEENIKEHKRITLKKKKFVGVIPLYKKKDVESNSDALIVGYVSKSATDTSESDFQLEIEDVNHKDIKYNLPVYSNKCKVKGYIYVGDNQFIGYRRKRLFILILIPFLFIGGCLLLKGVPEDIPHPKLADQENYRGSEDGNKKSGIIYTEFPGYTKCYVDSNKTSIQLYNPEGNKYYLTYSVYNTEDNSCILDDTGLIEPGKAFLWEAGSYLSKGDYNVYFNVKSYSMDDECRAGTSTTVQNITLHVY